jgi:Phage integrase family
MSQTSRSLPPWVWPVKPEQYDRTPDLRTEEIELLRDNLRYLKKGIHACEVLAKCDLPRLLRPLEDVCSHTRLHEKYQPGLKVLMLSEIAARARTFWGWSEEEWIEITKNTGHEKHTVAVFAYLLCGFNALHKFGRRNVLFHGIARRVFGKERIAALSGEIRDMLLQWGYRSRMASVYVPRVLCEVLVTNRSPHLEDITVEVLKAVERRRSSPLSTYCLSALSNVLAGCGIISAGIVRLDKRKGENPHSTEEIPGKWVQAVRYWHENSTHSRKVRNAKHGFLLRIGRWLSAKHPGIEGPEQWDRKLAVECMTMITNMRCGDWRPNGVGHVGTKVGQPLNAHTKLHNYTIVRTLFREMQEWGTIPPRFDPYRSFTPPRSVSAVVGSAPRIIADDVWAKLVWAGLNLTSEDVGRKRSDGGIYTFYPLEMIRAVALVWFFAGLRSDEIRRLRVGCIRWQQKETAKVCFLDVPVHKTGTAFTKPVDRIAGDAINAWEKVRPPQPKLCDPKTGEMVDFLFLYRMRQLATNYLNLHLIPRLCRKAGIPQHDVRGKIASHRARSTIATQLFNAKEPMSLFELQEWLGHRMPLSTQRYAKITPTKLMKSYSDAGYFARNLRAIEVLIDQDKVRSGLRPGEAWKFYDLGHGYCTYDFFDQCPHRMACAKCSFYIPKASTASALLEGKSNLLRMRQEIPLSDAEVTALDDGVSALNSLLVRLENVPTPAGPTPLQIRGGSERVAD